MAGRKLGRKTNHRRAMWRNMAVSLLTHEQITTTIPKAKSFQPFIEKLISCAKAGDLAARRRAMKMLGQDFVIVREADDPDVPRNPYGEVARKGGRLQGPRIVKHLMEEIAPRYADRTGGYTRIIKLGSHRIGDGADLCVIQLISDEDTGPQVAGQYSRRRDKANRRMTFAAQLRKGGKAEAAAPEDEEDKKKGQDPDVSETAEEGRTEPDSASEQQKDQPDNSPEPREGDNAEGDKDKG
ncbi:MAG: 50S ribosomal protein L17 [Phycisphaeraceae bacterium]